MMTPKEFIAEMKRITAEINALKCPHCAGRGWNWVGWGRWNREKCEACLGTGVKFK